MIWNAATWVPTKSISETRSPCSCRSTEGHSVVYQSSRRLRSWGRVYWLFPKLDRNGAKQLLVSANIKKKLSENCSYAESLSISKNSPDKAFIICFTAAFLLLGWITFYSVHVFNVVFLHVFNVVESSCFKSCVCFAVPMWSTELLQR